MVLRREHRWHRSRQVVRQYRFALPCEPDDQQLRAAWQRSGLSSPFEVCMSDPVLATILRMMARQGTKHSESEAIGGDDV